jgi:release factor glutamine methyltransferase
VKRSALHAAIRELVGGAQQARWVLDAFVDDRRDDAHVPDAVATHVLDLAREVGAGRPLQYALGTWEFRCLTVKVDERALIPRPETEHVVEVALRAATALEPTIVAVDLGTGSGAIALSLATELCGAEVHGVDLHAEALDLARENADRLGAEVTFHEGSWWSALPPSLHGRVSLLIANPPYVTEEEYRDLEVELTHEPRSALVAPPSTTGVDGLGDLEAIVRGAPVFLAPRAVVAFECAPQQCDALAEMSRSLGEVEVIVDLAGRSRGVLVRRTP